jgi:hypothetical protein
MDIHAHKVSTLSLYGLKPTSTILAKFENPDGSSGGFDAPAESCFRCLGVCPGYWSLESIANYASGHLIVKPGARVWVPNPSAVTV